MLSRINGKPCRAILKFTIPAAACLMIGWYLATGTSITSLSAYPGGGPPEVQMQSAPAGFQTTTVQHTYYKIYSKVYLKEGAYQTYGEHLDAHFKLFLREQNGQLRLSIAVPPELRYVYSNDNGTANFRLRDELFFNTVKAREDCTKNLFWKHHKMIFKDPEPEMSLPLAASDYGRYYCIKIRLNVDKPGWNFKPYKVFVADNPIVATGVDAHEGDYLDFSRTIMRSTYYDYNHIWGSNRPSGARHHYYRHLNEHFTLYTRQADGRLDLRINLPDGVALPGTRNINDFELKSLEHVVVNRKADCDRQAFESGATSHDQPEISMSITPTSADYGLHYCFKAGIKGERSWASDFNPYRIFYVPRPTTMPAPDGIWLGL